MQSRQSRQFRQLTAIERKAKFIQVLISKSQGKLGKPELEAIANHRWQLGYKYQDGLLEDFDLIERQMTIIVHADAKSFAKAATLNHTGMTHSWAGDDTFDQYGNWIVGDGEFGTHVDISHSNNGDVGSPETEDSPPNFDLTKTQVIAVKSVSHDSFNRESTVHEEEWNLHVLFKDSEFVVDPVVVEIINS